MREVFRVLSLSFVGPNHKLETQSHHQLPCLHYAYTYSHAVYNIVSQIISIQLNSLSLQIKLCTVRLSQKIFAFFVCSRIVYMCFKKVKNWKWRLLSSWKRTGLAQAWKDETGCERCRGREQEDHYKEQRPWCSQAEFAGSLRVQIVTH